MSAPAPTLSRIREMERGRSIGEVDNILSGIAVCGKHEVSGRIRTAKQKMGLAPDYLTLSTNVGIGARHTVVVAEAGRCGSTKPRRVFS